ncbi:MAG: hypothetical protein ACYCST_22020 [Acidimicrobiales bacterium]
MEIYPIEEILLYLWKSPNVSSVNHIKRIEGRDLDDDKVFEEFERLSNMKKPSKIDGFFYLIFGYIKYPEVFSNTDDVNHITCSYQMMKLLQKFDIIEQDILITDVLPPDIYNLRFHQKYKYIREQIFDKKTDGLDWIMSSFYHNLGFYEYHNLENKNINDMVKEHKINLLKFRD